MKAVVAAFNQEKALVGAFSVLTNLRTELFQALLSIVHALDQSETSTSWTNDSSPGQEAPHRLDVVGEEDPAEAASQLQLGRGAAALGHRACTSIHCLGQCPDSKGGLQKLNLNASLLNVPVILL